jgi:DNA-directed RNA polymerase specialized sigma24 family protein
MPTLNSLQYKESGLLIYYKCTKTDSRCAYTHNHSVLKLFTGLATPAFIAWNDTVIKALASLTPARREAFVLLRYEGMSVAAAAQIVGISEGALKIRAFHAYEALRAALAKMEAPLDSGADAGNLRAAGT